MKAHTVTPFVAGHVITPLLRPLPVLFAYAQHASRDPGFIQRDPVLSDEFSTHLDCLGEMVKTAAEAAGIEAHQFGDVLERITDLAGAHPEDLIRLLDRVDLELAHFSEVHKSALRRAYNLKPELYREVYTRFIASRRLLLVYQSQSSEGVAKLEETLSDRCYYDVKVVEEAYTTASIRRADCVAFAPTEEPVSSQTIEKLREHTVPFLVLVKLGTDLQRADMVQTRLAGLYRKNGIPLLHRPFPAIRLFQTIDRMIFEARLVKKPMPEVVETKEKEMAAVR